tara:strand:- start:270 stop:533 length:264 start_codon:yes stop_codon:yes gene_type:complete
MLVWTIPIVFSFGGFYALMMSTSASLESDVTSIQADLREHEALKAHPVTESRLDVIVTEQRALRVEVAEANENIAAICSAIPGARCK